MIQGNCQARRPRIWENIYPETHKMIFTNPQIDVSIKIMNIITETKPLKSLCKSLEKGDYMTIDTEFIREKTYYPKLCLIQVANDDVEAIIDPLADDIDMSPLFKLLQKKDLVKVFHGGRQDIEIFYFLTGTIPKNIFDTQIAGMVCGFGDQIGYESMIKRILSVQIDKGSRYTDWSRRPLSDKQLAYAMADVTHLRLAYKQIRDRLKKLNREDWVAEEMEIMTSADTYENPPELAWERIKINTRKPKALGILKEVAMWREKTAQSDDEPRGRVLRDKAITEMALNPPKTTEDLRKIRDVHPSFFEGERPEKVLKAVKRGLKLDKEDCPVKQKPKSLPPHISPIVEMLRVLLKLKCEEHDVAPKLIAVSSDLDQIAAYGKDAKVSALKGWRYKIFGQDALDLMAGKIGFVLEKGRIKLKKLN